MKPSHSIHLLVKKIHLFPLSLLSLSPGKRLLIVAISYCLGIAGLWFFFPLAHNGASMFLPIISASWLFRYRGLIVSLVGNGLAFQLTYYLLLKGMLSDQAFMLGALLGFGSSLGIGLVVCWLRIALDLMYRARQRALTAEQERLQALQAESHAKLAYEYQYKLNAHKDDFLLLASHELRTPLTVLGGALELLNQSYEHLSAADRTTILTQAYESQNELAELVERVLDAAAVMNDLPQTQIEAISLQRLLQDVLGRLERKELAAYRVRVQVPEQIQVLVDPQYLRQVLHNLFSNIFKYVPTQTEILIEAVQPTSSDLVCLSIQDAGPGIPPEEAPLLFEKFVRLTRDRTGSKLGTGLGLYLCRRFLEAMGGSIRVESSGVVGEGSRFCITLLPVFLTEKTEWRIAP